MMRKCHEKSSVNVFADLGFSDSEREMVKAKLTLQIYQLLKAGGLTRRLPPLKSKSFTDYSPAATKTPPR